MKKLTIIFMLLGLGVSSMACSPQKVIEKIKTTTSNEVDEKGENDNVFLALKANNGSSGFDFLAKTPKNKDFQDIDIGPSGFSVTYSDTLNRIFFVDRYGTIRTHSSNDTKEFGHNSSNSYRSSAGYKIFDLGVAYKMPEDKSSLVYTTNEGKLFYVDSNGAQKMIWDGIGYTPSYDSYGYINNAYFDISENGEFIFYNSTTSEDKLDSSQYSFYRYNIKTGENLDIEYGVDKFAISSNGEVMIYSVPDDKSVYIKNTKNNTVRKYAAALPVDMKIFDDGSAMFLNSIEESSMSGFVTYIDSNGDVHEIPSKVTCYELIDDMSYIQVNDKKIHFINGEKILCAYDIENDSVEILFDKRIVDFETIENEIYLTTENGDIYKIDKKGNEKLITDKKSDHYESTKIENLTDKKVIIKSQVGELYINDKLIAEAVKDYVIYNGRVAYCTFDDNVYTFDIKNEKPKLEFSGYKNFDCIYYGNDILYSSEYVETNM